MILRRGRAANEYWSYCEEVGCDVYELLQSVSGSLGEPMGLWLPQALRDPDTSEYVMGVEVSVDFAGPVPEHVQTVLLPPQDFLIFQGPPYDEAAMGEAIGQVIRFADAFDPTPLGWVWSSTGLRYQLAPIGTRGYIEGRPVQPIEEPPC